MFYAGIPMNVFYNKNALSRNAVSVVLLIAQG